MKLRRLFLFAPITVTVITSVVYLSISLALLIVHETVPAAPTSSTIYRGLNLTEAWLDLKELSNGYHPFNSHRNDQVRAWLLSRIYGILDENQVNWEVLGENRTVRILVDPSIGLNKRGYDISTQALPYEVVVFDDVVSNYTSTALTSIGIGGKKAGISTYFEGSNLIVYVRGTKDENCDWWKSTSSCARQLDAAGGVLVNAHFDSVSTGYGATDDGMGVVTILQLIKYFTTKGNQPDHGLVALFNNNEEDGLYGAKAFLSHPMASFVHTFLNLEGAGAGGRATLFRSTDTEVTRAYSKSPHPFGTIVSAEGFSLGFVRSETDYVVFRAEGYRGLDVAFWEPRSRYHTNQDDAKHASKSSLWHMLSASVETIKYLTANENEFDVSKGHDDKGTNGVWFDLFGRFFAIFELRTLFAWSLTLLIASPIILLIVSYLLSRKDKYFLFTGTIKFEGQESQWVSLKGWHGAFRFPLVFIISSAITVGSAFLLRKINPLIIYSSQYSVWSMFLTLFFCVSWCLMAGCNAIRPSALHRTYALVWMFSFGWILLILVTIYEDRFQISSGYIFVFYQGAIFLATFIGLCELFALPTKRSVFESAHEEDRARETTSPISNTDDPTTTSRTGQNEEEEESSEEMPLLGGKSHRRFIFTTFSRGYQRSSSDQNNKLNDQSDGKNKYAHEQEWSNNLPSWPWLLQFLILGPLPLIIAGQVGLLLVSATSQTAADGSSLIFPYLVVAIFSIIYLLPLTPFLHRITHHLPVFLFVIFIITLVYNLISFPFSAENRYKSYFQQVMNLDNGQNQVTIVGIEEYIRDIISYIPSVSGQSISCNPRPEIRSGLSFCSYEGIAPNVVSSVRNEVSQVKTYKEWLTYNVTRSPNENKATFRISGHETKSCVIRFDLPFSAFNVHGAALNDGRWPDVPETGSNQIKLWHRNWDREWVVDVEWLAHEGEELYESRSGQVVCLWSDHNEPGTIPALDEILRFMPVWATVVKLTDGLVEGSKAFSI